MTKFFTATALILSTFAGNFALSSNSNQNVVTPEFQIPEVQVTESTPNPEIPTVTPTVSNGTIPAESTIVPTAYTTVSDFTLDDFFSNRDSRTTIDSETPVTITLNGTSATATGEDTSGVTIDGSIITITAEGSYIFTGTLDEGRIIVEMADDSDKVQLVLDHMSITSSTEAPIHVKTADKAFITMTEGSVNYITGNLTDDASTDGAVHSKCDVTFNGEGTLNVKSTGGDGLVGKDELTITSGTYNITTDGHGLDSNDGIAILDGTFHITAGKDGMHAEHSTNETKGYIFIADGTFQITADRDGLDSAYYLEIWDGNFDIITNGGWEAAPVKVASANNMGGGMGQMGGQTGATRPGMTGGTAEMDFDEMKAMILVRFPDLADQLDGITTTSELEQLMMDMMALENQGGQMGGMGQTGEMTQGGQMGGMGQEGEMTQGGQMGGMGQIGEMTQGGQMGGMGQEGEMTQGGQMGAMGQTGEMTQGGQMGGMGQTGEMTQDGQLGEGQNQGAAVTRPDLEAGFVYDDPTVSDDASVSTKGLKAKGAIRLFGGTFVLDCYDDAIHSDISVEIHEGDYEISTADDGIHANWDTIITNGNINIVTCFEGIEGQRIQIAGGNIDMYCGDDGINAATANADPENSKISLYISGGNITMDTNAEGDGVDSNGSILITGGNILVSSTTDVRDTALDSSAESIISGGTFIATGSNSGTIQNFNTGSTQGSILQILSAVTEGQVTLTDSQGNVLVDFMPAKAYQGIHISIPELTVGVTYTLVSGTVTNTITMESLQQGGSASTTRPGGR